MKFLGRPWFLIFCLFIIFTAKGRADVSNILHGFFFNETMNKPIPGALIVLTSCDQKTVVDQTYTMDNGSFTLKAPNTPDCYSLVATKDKLTQRKFFDSKQVQAIIWIYHQDITEEPLNKALNYFLKELDHIFSALTGAFISLLSMWLIDRGKLYYHARPLKETREKILPLLDKAFEALQIYAKSGNDSEEKKKARTDYECNINKLIKITQDDVRRMNFDTSSISPIGNGTLISNLENFVEIIKEIKQLTEKTLDDMANYPPSKRTSYFNDIKDRLTKI